MISLLTSFLSFPYKIISFDEMVGQIRTRLIRPASQIGLIIWVVGKIKWKIGLITVKARYNEPR